MKKINLLLICALAILQISVAQNFVGSYTMHVENHKTKPNGHTPTAPPARPRSGNRNARVLRITWNRIRAVSQKWSILSVGLVVATKANR